MAMMRAGAYSEKFQKLEKERVKQLKEQDKVNRGKAQLFSKQTAQRRKALEDKKKAMVAAEEDRRRKALEERREAQKAATKRFRSALGRIKSTSSRGQASTTTTTTTTKNSTSQAFLEYYLPSKPKPTASSQNSEGGGQERRALGKDVEIKLKPKNGYHLPRRNGMQYRTPSLDDVMEKIKGEKRVAVIQEPAAVNHGRIVYHHKIPNLFSEQSQSSMGKRSSSDPTLSSPRNAVNGGKLSSAALSDLARRTSDENVVFRAVPSQATNGAVLEEDLRITSPDSSSGESLISNPPLTPDLNDSLDTPKNSTVFTIGGEKLAVSETDASNTTTNVTSSTTGQPVYVCENNVTDSLDSLEDHQTPKQTHSAPVFNRSHQQIQSFQRKLVKEKPKVVGILKKSMSNKGPLGNNLSRAKRVSFSDKLETSYSNGTPRKSSPDTGYIDPAKLELWKRVLPNGVTTQYLPNSAFTPKMKVSLSSKASQSPSTPQKTNGISIHIPVVTAETQSKLDSPNYDVPVKATPHVEPPTSAQPHVSMASVGLNGVMPTSEYSMDPLNSTSQELTNRKQILLENTPTDDDINNLWDQIRSALEDNQKVFVPPQVFNFRVQHPSRQDPPSSSADSLASSGFTHKEDQRSARKNTSADRFYSRPSDPPTQRGTQKQPNLSRPTRYQSNYSPQSAPLLGRRGHAVTYPVVSRNKPPAQMTSTEPDTSRATGGRKGPTALSVEEKRLMLSIENINQKIKDHMKRLPNVAKFQSPVSPEPPDFTEVYPHPPPSPTPPQMHRVSSKQPHPPSGHMYSPSKSRARRPPKSVPLVTTASSQSGGEHAQSVRTRPAQHRTVFYNA